MLWQLFNYRREDSYIPQIAVLCSTQKNNMSNFTLKMNDLSCRNVH